MSKAIRLSEEKRKQEQEKLNACLLELLREDDNRYCADCDAKGPRWVSWNLGVFLCIRCAGIHRNLGVHVSKVKSINLDSWTPEQVQSMRVGGNCKARAVYEAHLPDHFRRPQSDSALEAFIRAKYDQKRYIMKDWVKPKVNVEDLPCWDELQDLARGGTGMKKSLNVSNATRAGKQKQAPPAKLVSAPLTADVQKSQKAAPPPVTSSALQDLVDLTPDVTPASAQPSVGGGIDDLLGLGSAGPQTQSPSLNLSSSSLVSPSGGTSVMSPAQQQAPPPEPVSNGEMKSRDLSLLGSGGNDGRKWKTDIMALYGAGGSTTPTGGMGQMPFDPLGNQHYFSQQQQGQMYSPQQMQYPGVPQQMGGYFPPQGMVQGGQYYGAYPSVPSPMGYSPFPGQQMMAQQGVPSPMGGYGMQSVQNQFAGMNLQTTTNVPPGNTLATNLWQ